MIDVESASRGAFAPAPAFAKAMYDEWREAMLDGAFECAWSICDEVLQQRAGQSCAHLPHHLRWVWDGTPLTGRRVLVRCYHGLGDTLQFIRFVPLIAALAREVIVEAQPELLPLISSVSPQAQWLPLHAELPHFDVAVESMEVPHALRLTLQDLPGPMPYLGTRGMQAKGARSILRSKASGTVRRPRVGLVWSGGDWRRARSVPPRCLLPLLELPVDFVGLQLGPARRGPDAARLIAGLSGMIPEDMPIAGTASLMQDLDLVITIDSMAAHLAGALRRPVWTLLDAEPDWRWMRNRCDSPWYPSMRLFRQPGPGAWQPVIEAVKAALEILLSPLPGTGVAGLLLSERDILSHQRGV